MEKIKEVWSSIIDYEGIYEISNYCRVKSLKRIVANSHSISMTIKERILKPSKSKDGYLQVILCKKGKIKSFKIHKLVSIAFIQNPENKPEVNHKNGIKTDNRVENLEWVTRIENMNHAWESGFIKKGEQTSFSKLKEKDVLEIRISKLKQIELSKIYNVNPTCINKIISRQNWKHI